MQKLLAAYKKQPSPSNRVRLQRYMDAHPCYLLTATLDMVHFLRSNEFKL